MLIINELSDCDVDLFPGVLTINDRIDYDRAPYISLTTFTVLATDSGLPPRGNQTVVSVRIKNINDNSPIFDKVCMHVYENQQ